MTIRTEITSQDWKAFVRFAAQRAGNDPELRVRRLLVAIGFGAILGILSLPSPLGLRPLSLWLGAVLGVLWVWILAMVRMQRLAPSPDGYILGPRELQVTDQGVCERSARHESLFQWSLVRGVERGGQHLFIMVDTMAAFIVPLRSFSSDSEREQFEREIQARLAARRAATATATGGGGQGRP